MLYSCPRCGKIHEKGKCTAQRKRIYTGGDERKERSSYAWTKKSLEIREKAKGLCEACKAQGRYTYKNLEVHHIVKLWEDKTKLLDNENLICLCVEHHKQADNGEISQDYLRQLAKIREAE